MIKKVPVRVLSFALSVCLLAPMLSVIPAQAAAKTMSLAEAKGLGLSASDTYQNLQSKLELAQVQYDQAVESLRLKEENQKSFRWSPLLSFKLPEQPNLTEAYEYEYKPQEYQSQIETLEHDITDEVYQIYYDISALFVDVYQLQESIAYNEERLETYEKALSKNQARLAMGTASQSDIDTLTSKVNTIESTLVSDKASFEAKKKKLGNLIDVDVTAGYTFQSPYVDGDIDRSLLEEIIEYTLEHDQSYYEAKVTTQNALLSLNTNYRLMKEQYGADLSYVDQYIDTLKKGESVQSATFKKAYNNMLKAVDAPWTGSYHIYWFISIPKEWFKGEIDGVRYVEDEPYALYESALEYQTAIKDQEAVEQEIRDSVTDTYENYASTRRSLKSIEESLAEKKTELDKSKTLNMTGQMTYDEYAAVQEEYEDLQMDLMETQADYSDLLYSFDRLTCGKISDLLNLTTIAVSADSSGGFSYAVETEGSGVYYYIHQLASESVFEFGLTVTEDAEVAISDFELWIDGVQIGERTSLSGTIRHLTFDLEETGKTFVRLYNNGEFVDDCEFDPTVYSGRLTIKSYAVETTEDEVVGRYNIATNDMGMVVINLIPDMDTDYAYYNITTESGNYLIGDKKIDINKDFTYLSLIQDNLDRLIINFYDENETLEYSARFDTSDKTIHKITESSSEE